MPSWRLTIPATIKLISMDASGWVIEGEGMAPVADVVAAPPPPYEPPAGTIPLPEDDVPFDWPPQPGFRPERAEQRYAGIGEGLYAGATIFANPLPQSHLWAGTIYQGRVGGWDLAGYDLWAPRDAKPGVIRRALRTGKVS